jgi:hypothetical protein
MLATGGAARRVALARERGAMKRLVSTRRAAAHDPCFTAEVRFSKRSGSKVPPNESKASTRNSRFVPQSHAPGIEAEVGWREAHVHLDAWQNAAPEALGDVGAPCSSTSRRWIRRAVWRCFVWRLVVGLDVSCVVHVRSTTRTGPPPCPSWSPPRGAGAGALLLTDHDSLGARRDGWDAGRRARRGRVRRGSE